MVAPMDRRAVRARVAELALRHVRAGDPVGWFEELYRDARGDVEQIPWADLTPNPFLQAWLNDNPGLSGEALVVGCGLGDDAEAVSAAGLAVTAFDVSPTSIVWCRERFPDSIVDYQVANLLAPPESWNKRFDLIIEIYTVQSLPVDVRFAALDSLTSLLRHGGRLVLVTRARDDDDEPSGPPWALSGAELEQLLIGRMSLDRFEDFYDDEDPPERRFVAVYRKPRSLIV